MRYFETKAFKEIKESIKEIHKENTKFKNDSKELSRRFAKKFGKIIPEISRSIILPPYWSYGREKLNNEIYDFFKDVEKEIGYVYPTVNCRVNYIAYSLLRGRKIEEVEQKTNTTEFYKNNLYKKADDLFLSWKSKIEKEIEENKKETISS